MSRLNRTCVVCGKKYSYCPNCFDDSNKPTWMTICCSDNCREIFVSCSDYEAGSISIDKLRSILDHCDLYNKEAFHHVIQKDIEKAYEVAITEPVIQDQEVELVKMEPSGSAIIRTSTKRIKNKKDCAK